MPNHVKNRLVVIGTPEQVKQVFEKYNTHYPAKLMVSNGKIVCIKKDKDDLSRGWYDPKSGVFETRTETVIGLPDDWTFMIDQASNQFPDFNKIVPQPENIFKGDLGLEERARCIAEDRPNWLDWNIANWGTKWNSYDCCEEGNNSFTFHTAWAGVPDLILKLSEQNPGVELLYEYADENTGYDCASYKMFSGEVVEAQEPEEDSREAYELAFKLRPEDREYYELVNGAYRPEDSD